MHDSRLAPYYDPEFGNTPDDGNMPHTHNVRSKLKDKAFVWSKNAGSLVVSGGALVGVKFGVGVLMAGSGFLPLMATTALASGVCSFALQYTMARMQGKATPKFFSTVGTTAANVATMGLFSVGKTIAQAFNQRSLKALFDWRDPASYLKLGVFAGAAYAGWSIWEEQDDAQALKDIYADTGDGATIEQNETQTEDLTIPQQDKTLEDTPGMYGEQTRMIGELTDDSVETETETETENETKANTAPSQDAGKNDISTSDAKNETMQDGDSQSSNDAGDPDTQTNDETDTDEVGMPLDEALSEASALLGENPDQYLQEALERAENGSAQGIKDLAQSLLNGENGAPQDIDNAMALYEHAAEAGSEQAASDLATIQELGTDYFVLEHAEQALEGVESEYVQDAYARAEDGNAQGMKDLAHAFLTGRGDLDQDINRAMQLYEQAAEAGNEQAAEDLQTVEELGADYFEDKFGDADEEQASTATEEPLKVADAQYVTTDNGYSVMYDFQQVSQINDDSYATVQIGDQQTRIDVDPPAGAASIDTSEMEQEHLRQLISNQVRPEAREFFLNNNQPRPGA